MVVVVAAGRGGAPSDDATPTHDKDADADADVDGARWLSCGSDGLMSLRVQALRPIGRQLAQDADDDDRDIDFSSVGLYLIGLQVVATLGVAAVNSVLCCWLLPSRAVSAVRTLAITSAVSLLCVRKPLRVGRPRGVGTLFNCLRPAVALYVGTLVLEQLVSTCVSPDAADEPSTGARRMIYHATAAVLLGSGLARARRPQSESDGPFVVGALAVCVLAMLPPAAVEAHAGPLCDPATLLEAGERVLRAVLFGGVYVALAYAAAPTRNASDENFVCVMRAGAAAVWVLCVSAWLLPLAPVQVGVILFSRLGDDDDGDAPRANEFLPLNGARSPDYDVGNSIATLTTVTALADGGAEAMHGAVARSAHALGATSGLRFAALAPDAGHAHAGGGHADLKDGFEMSASVLAAIAAREAGDA